MKVLVSGGTGFIGKHLVEALVEGGSRVKVIARDPRKAKSVEERGVKVILGDLGDKEFLGKELAGIEVVYHLAAIPGQIWGTPWEEYRRVNVDYTQNLLEASLANKIKRFIFCSSIQAADTSTFYGKSKLEAEKAVKRSGLEYVIVRPGVVYGPGDKRVILRIYQRIQKGVFPLIDGGKARLAIVFIDDLIDLFLKGLTSKTKNKIFWGIGEEIAFRNLVEIATKELGKPCWMISLPAELVKIIAVPFEAVSSITGTYPVLNRKRVDFVTSDWHFDISKEARELWQPKVKLGEGIKKTIEWYRNHGYI